MLTKKERLERLEREVRKTRRRLRASVGAVSTRPPDGRTISYPESSLLLHDAEGVVSWSAPR